MSRWVTALGVAAGLALACAAPAAQPDPVKAKLDKVRAAYEAELTAAEKGVAEAIDKAEAAARKRGDKAAVDKIKGEREFFELTGVVPKSVPAGITQKVVAARKPLDAACATAVKEYTRASKDAEAAAVEKERAELKDAPTLRPRYFLVVNKNSELPMAAKEKGDPGSRLVQTNRTGADTQLWSLVPTSDADVYLLRNKASGLFVSNAGSRTPAHDLTLEKDGGDGTRWALEREGVYFLFKNTHGGLNMAPGGASKEAGERIIQWPKAEKGDEFRWTFVAAKPK
jgi:hypothetical protein